MFILGIESSCDDTSAALLDCSKSGCFVLRELTASQIDIHKKYGGVVPEIAGRAHAEKIIPLIEEVLKGKKPEAIAVAAGPGLITGLLVGSEAARTLAAVWDLPLLRVNHMAGHIHSVELNNQTKGKPTKKKTTPSIKYPALALIVSGGHTEIQIIKKPGQYKILGATRDDAAGECFDKVAKLLGLPYPGGPQISKLAESGNTEAIKFPRPMLESDNFDFSFAGLKTSILYWLKENQLRKNKNDRTKKINLNDFCASFEQAIIDTLVSKTIRAAKKYKPRTIILCGGVSANKKLRETLAKTIKQEISASQLMMPESKYCMDNAAMIACAGYQLVENKKFTPWRKLQADPNWELGRK